MALRDKNQKRNRTTLIQELKKNVIEFNSNPQNGIMALGWYLDGDVNAAGNSAIASVILDGIEAIENHPDFKSVSPTEVRLPPLPSMGASYTYTEAKKFLNCVLPTLLGSRPGYGDTNNKILHKPSWWSLPRWQSINQTPGFTKDELFRLIVSIYEYHGSALPISLGSDQVPHPDLQQNEVSALPASSNTLVSDQVSHHDIQLNQDSLLPISLGSDAVSYSDLEQNQVSAMPATSNSLVSDQVLHSDIQLNHDSALPYTSHSLDGISGITSTHVAPWLIAESVHPMYPCSSYPALPDPEALINQPMQGECSISQPDSPTNTSPILKPRHVNVFEDRINQSQKRKQGIGIGN